MQTRIKKANIPHPLRLKTPCALCRHDHLHKNPLCTHCETLLPPLGPACMHCATPLPNTSDAHVMRCGFCIKQPPALDYTYTPYRFLEPLRTLVHDFKYREQLYLSPFLAEKMRLASALKLTGIKQVDLWCIAKTCLD